MVKEELNNDIGNKPIIIDFKPWYFSGQEQLLKQFFQILANNIESQLSKSNKKLREMAKVISKNL